MKIHTALPAAAQATLCLLAALAGPAMAQTSVNNAWVRGTVPQQKATGAFMQLTSVRGGRLISVASSAAGMVEIHAMSMQGSTMQMRALDQGLELPAGQAVLLKPGGNHVMLMDLKRPLKAGDSVPLTLVIEDRDGKRETIAVEAPVKALGAPD